MGWLPAQAQVQKSYNDLYSQILTEKTQWPSQLEKQKANVNQAESQFETSQSVLNISLVEQQRLQADLETQKQHLSFLKRVEPLSIKEKEKIKQRVVNSGEFSNPAQVTLASLNQKAGQLSQQENLKQNEIDLNQQKIVDLKGTAEYQGYLSHRSQLRRDKRSKENELAQVRSDIRNLQSDVNALGFALNASERREENARIRMVRIRQQIPNLRRDIRTLQSEIQNLQQDTQQKRQTKRQVESRRDQTKLKIRQKENQLSQEGADKAAIKAELRQLRQQLQQQNQRISRLTNQIQSNQRAISQKENQQQQKQREITRLENDLQQQERIVAQEDIRQIQIEGDIRDKERQINSLEFDESSLISSINVIDNQIVRVQSQINQYHATHIQPIEQSIGQLESAKQKLVQRRVALQEARGDLVTQNQNIATAKERIPGQEQLIQSKNTQLSAKDLEVVQLKNQAKTLEMAMDQEIQSFNNLIASIRTKRNQLKTLEQDFIDEIDSKKNGGN